MPSLWSSLPSVADQVLARNQARALDLSSDAWQWQLDRGYWRPVLPGVVTTHSGIPTERQMDWAAVLKVGKEALRAGDAVLRAAGFPFSQLAIIDVATERKDLKPHRAYDGTIVRPHLVGGLGPLRDPAEVLPSMTLPAAVLFAAEWSPTDRAAEWRVATAVQRGLVTVPELRALYDDRLDLGRRDLLPRVFDDVELGAHAMSELDLLRLCRDFGLPEPDEMQVAVRTAGGKRFLDFRYHRPRVRGEIDGAHHRWVDSWEADLLRSNDVALLSRGSDEIQLRWSGAQVRHDRTTVARQLRQALGL